MQTPRRIVLCLPDGVPRTDPAPGETAKRDAELVFEWDERAAGVVGFGEGGWRAVELAERHPDLVDRLVLISTPPPASNDAPSGVEAKTLLLYGSLDGGQRQATWWKTTMGGRIEMVPREGPDILERVWARALAHVAPGTTR
jgi:pimeloyl-ACP methyl ester carboxylesterase